MVEEAYANRDPMEMAQNKTFKLRLNCWFVVRALTLMSPLKIVSVSHLL